MGVPGMRGGYVGVDVFFVLSGYLITQLLIQEIESTGTLDLVVFYSRRARRLLPALGVVVTVTAGAGFLVYAPMEQLELAKTALSSAVYASNVLFARRYTDYQGGDSHGNPFLHTWSLSVEEQFYILWPVLVLLAMRGRARDGARARLLRWMVAVAVISLVLSLRLTAVRQPSAFFLTPARGWEFALGSVGTLLGGGGGVLTGLTGVAAILVSGTLFNDSTAFPGVAALLPALGTVLVLRGTTGTNNAISKVLSLRPLQEIGRLSYSWYLWHWPVLVVSVALFGSLSLGTKVALAGFSLLIAEASYRLIENPIRRSPRFAGMRWGSLAMAAGIAALGIGVSVVWWGLSVRLSRDPAQARFAAARGDVPIVYQNGCHVELYGARLPACEFGPDDATQTVVQFGDSHAAQWFPALEEIARSRRWRLVVLTKAACPAVNEPYLNAQMNRMNVECEQWRAGALARIRSMRPAFVVMSSIVETYPYTDAEWLSGTASILGTLVEASQRVILLRDTPAPGFDVPVCLAREAWRPRFVPSAPCAFRSQTSRWSRVFEIQRQAAARFPNVRAVDLSEAICPLGACALEAGGVVLYRDESHISKRFSESLAPALSAKLDS